MFASFFFRAPIPGATALLSTVIEASAPSKIVMGGNSFGARSSKGVAQLATDAGDLHVPTSAGDGALTAAALEAHNAAMAAAPPQ